jgi:hypothetical protein
MRMLPTSQRKPSLPRALLGLHPLWSATDTKVGPIEYRRDRVSGAQNPSLGGLGAVRTFGAGNTPVGEGAVSDWPGRDCGIRRPSPQETALSGAEVRHAIRHDLLDGGPQ